jgi:hypothetical protein
MENNTLETLTSIGWLNQIDLTVLARLEQWEQITLKGIQTLLDCTGQNSHEASNRLSRLEGLRLITRVEIPQDFRPECQFAYRLHPLLDASLQRLKKFIGDDLCHSISRPLADEDSENREEGW